MPQRALKHFLLLTVFIWSYSSVFAQSKITNIATTAAAASDVTSNVNSPSDVTNNIISNTNYNVLYGRGDSVVVDSYTVSGVATSFSNFVYPDTLILRRTDASRLINMWYTLIDDPANDPSISGIPDGFNTVADPDELSVDAAKVSDEDAIYLTRNINVGYDNILVNEDDGTPLSPIQAQIERVDVIWYNGIVTSEPDNSVFPVIERGGNDQIKIAAILSLDANGDPASYSSLIDIEVSDWPGGTTDGVLYNNFLALRRQTVGSDPIPVINFGADVSTNGEQLVQGVAVSFTEFGIASNQVIYGYSIFAFDVNTNDHTLTDISSFPTNTTASNSGFDFAAGTAAVVSNDNNLTEAKGPGGYLQGLATWLKADNAVTSAIDGGNVTDWQDSWIGDNDATNGISFPIYKITSEAINFNPTVDFTSGSTSLSINNNSDFNTDNNASTQYQKKGIYITFKTDADVSTRQVLYEQGSETRGINIYLEDNSGTDELFVTAWNRNNDGTGSPWNNSGNVSTISTPINSNSLYMLGIEFDGNASISGSIKGYLNGSIFGTLSNVGLLWDDTGDIEIGAAGGNSQYSNGSGSGTNSFKGIISEFIYVNEPTEFTSTSRKRIESYLGVKYGITLDDAGSYDYLNSAGQIVFDGTNNASIGGYYEYKSNISGIGRDDGSFLQQIKSKSENSSAILTVERTTDFSSDNTYFIWGNNGGSTNESNQISDGDINDDLPPGINSRMLTVWRAAETGQSGSLNISFDLTGLGYSLSEVSEFSLLIATNDASQTGNNLFKNAQINTGGTIEGNVITFSNVNIENGEFFTLGTSYTSCAPGGVTNNLSLWLKADLGPDNTTNEADVSTWEDKAGVNNVTAPSSSTSPNYLSSGLNYNPVINFDGVDEELNGAAGFYTNAYYTVIIPNATVSNASGLEASIGISAPSPASTPSDLGCFCLGSLSGDITNEVATHAIGSDAVDPSNVDEWRAGITSASLTLDTGVPQLFGIKDNAGSTSTEMFLNGNNLQSETSGTFITSSNQDFVIGNLNTGAGFDRFFDGKIAEVISFSVRPTDIEHAQVQSYLAIKYGISLSTDSDNDAVLNENINGTLNEGDYLASDGTTFPWKYDATYSNDVAGIGRDDNSCLTQKQSKSENSDGIVTIGLNTIATTNQENSNAFDLNLSFLLWGNNDGATAFASKTTGVTGIGNVKERMTRIWHVEETGTIGTVSISFDLSGLGYTTNASDFTLIKSSSESLTSPTTYTGGTMDGNIITFNNIDFSDEDYFTLGTQNNTTGPGGVTTDLALWLKANSGTNTIVEGENVTSWNDQSSNGNNATQTNFAGSTLIEPTFQASEINFNPTIRIQDPGSNNASFLETSSNSTAGDFSLIAVIKTGQNGGTQDNFNQCPAIIGAETTALTGLLDYGLGMENGQVILNASSGDAFDIETTGSFNDNAPHILTATRVQTGGSLELFVDGFSEGTTTAGSGLTLSEPTSFGIGNHSSEEIASQFDGSIAEAIVYNDDLTSSERLQVESYLGLKYGLTLSKSGGGTAGDYVNSNGTLRWDASAVGSYHNDVAGVIRDDGSAFTQLKSKSQNSDAIITIEAASLTNDDSFIIWGNDGASLEERNNSELPAGILSRLNREWLVEENGSGTVGTVTITFDLSSINGPQGVGTNNLNEIRLLTDIVDSDFSTGVTQTIPSSTNAENNTVSFEIDFADGTYFTLGSEEKYALPVTLVSFETKVINEEVNLNWTTSTEINNSHFVIERSNNGYDFTELTRIDGKGNSQAITNYSYIDASPLNGFSFYRLKQMDFGGSYDYSEVQSVFVDKGKENIVRFYPNPISRGNLLKLRHNLNENSTGSIQIIDSKGQTLLTKFVTLNPNQPLIAIETNTMSRGINVIKLILQNGESFSYRVLVN